MIGVKFNSWSKVYHYKTAGLQFSVGDHAVVQTASELKVVLVTHVDAESKVDVEFKEVFGKVQLA